MSLEIITFMLIVVPLAVIFTILTLIFRSIWWFAFVPGVLWIMFGFFGIAQRQQGIIAYQFQSELSLVWIVVGIGMMFAPFYIRRKQKSITETLEEDDIAAYKREREEFEQATGSYKLTKPRDRFERL